MLDHRQTSSDSANSVRRSLEQGRASRKAGSVYGPSTDPRRTLDGPSTHFLFHLGPRKSLRNRILTILSRIFELIIRIFNYLPLTSR